jgi:predicted ATPase
MTSAAASSSGGRIVITGAPGTGKTSLLKSLKLQGYEVVPEPAREIIAEQRSVNGRGTWESDTRLFLELLLSRSLLRFRDYGAGTLFYDRGIPDCLAYAQLAGISFPAGQTAAEVYRYDGPLFIAPPWKDIYKTDDERTLSFSAVKEFHESLVAVYSSLGYNLEELPLISPDQRAEWIGARLLEC